MSIMTIVSIALGVLLALGFFIGFLRSWKKSTIRLVLILVSFAGAFLLSSTIAGFLMNKYVSGLVLSVFGFTLDFESIIGDIAGDLIGEGTALTNFATAILNIFVKIIAFLVVFISLMVVTLIIYFVIAGIMSSKEKRKSVGKVKPKAWERLIGGFVGIVATLALCIALFTPVFGFMNICDKFLSESGTTATASAYVDTTLVAGKFYTEDEKIGKVETYLEKYDKLRDEYKNSFAGVMFTYSGVDAIGKTTFDKLSTVTQDGVKVNFSDECVNLVNVYNVYKTGFVENKFDLATSASVETIEKIYGVARKSEVMKSFIVELVPKMATKWTNNEKFLGMELPVTGDLKEIVVELLGVFNTNEFDVIDENILILIDSIKIANENDVISSVNGGSSVLDVIDNGTFVKDEINNLAKSAEFRRVLPNVMTTTIKLAYKQVLSDPGTKLDQEFSQEKISQIVWSNESDITQTIVTKMFKFFDQTEILDYLGDFGDVIDASRRSDILSKPVKTLMYDYINEKVTGVNNDVKAVLLNAFSDDNWNSQTFKYADLFTTISTTAKVAKKIEGAELTDLEGTLGSLLSDETGATKDVIKNAIDEGALDDLIGTGTKSDVYKDMIYKVLDKTTSETVKSDLTAGQVIVAIVNNESSDKSIFGETEEDKNTGAELAVEALTGSDAIMELIKEDVDSGSSNVKGYVDNLSQEDKTAFESAINNLAEGENKTTLSKLFGLSSN